MIRNTPPPQSSRKARSLLHISTAAAALLLSSGCVVDSDSPPTNDEGQSGGPTEPERTSSESLNPSGREAIASSTTSSTPIGQDYLIDIYALENVGNGLLRLRLGITNNSNESYFFHDGLSDFDNPYTANRITLLDSNNQTRHLSFNQNDGSCFCSIMEEDIPSGGTADMWVIFPLPPEGVTTMTITTPLTPPIFDVSISESSETVENSGLADPEIIPLTMISDDIEDNTGRTESNEKVSIILSSDVLFETNKANLSADAQEILEQVATEIDDASSATVAIDGYADNTGSNTVNIPLSKDRAEAVESVLSDLVNRNGVVFEVDGHGSDDPIADNETKEGRERNRRVSVTFEK